jgi:uncharacterized integral membrane protein
MTPPAENRMPVGGEGDLPPRPPVPGGIGEPPPPRDDPGAFRDPVPAPTTEAEPMPAPGSSIHAPGATPSEIGTPRAPDEIGGPDEVGGLGRRGEVGGPGGLTARPGAARPRMFTRVSAAWLGIWAGVLVVILLIIFIGQNTADVRIRFLWMDGLIPTALALLIAGVGGAIIAMAVAAARIVQLRRLVRRRRD